MTISDDLDDRKPRKAILFSDSLNRVLYLDHVRSLSDDDLVALTEELTHVSASIKSHFLHLEKRFELDYDLDDTQLVRARKKYYYVKRFVLEVDRERERRFQESQGIFFHQEDPEGYKQAMNALRSRRKDLFSYAMSVSTQEAFMKLLKDNYGEDKINELTLRAKVIANKSLLEEPLLSSTGS